MDESGQIDQLFEACDLDGSGYIDKQELSAMCPELSDEQLTNIFAQLDGDGDGRISSAEFSQGFMGMRDTLLGSPAGKDDSLIINNNDNDVMDAGITGSNNRRGRGKR